MNGDVSRQQLLEDVLNLTRTHEFDGVNLNWDERLIDDLIKDRDSFSVFVAVCPSSPSEFQMLRNSTPSHFVIMATVPNRGERKDFFDIATLDE